MKEVDLAVLPVKPGNDSGYSIMVHHDITNFNLNESKIKYASRATDLQKLKNVFKLYPPSSLSNFKGRNTADTVFCGDSILYPYCKTLFNKKLIVRYHNLYLKLFEKYSVYEMFQKFGFKYTYLIISFARLEKEIIANKDITHIFITKDDERHAQKYLSKESDYFVESFVNIKVADTYKNGFQSFRLIWFGGASTHKKPEISYFINNVFNHLYEKDERYEFWLFGKNTEMFNDPDMNIFGKGYYEGNDIPFDGNGIYINPDNEGLGIKVKIKNLIENGYSFISTPEGYFGYENIIYDNKIVSDIDNWAYKLLEKRI